MAFTKTIEDLFICDFKGLINHLTNFFFMVKE
jgi:hypothetical protein